MFVRNNTNLPSDPHYPTTSFSALGYEINPDGQIVSIKPPHNHFPFFLTDNDRANHVHKEAMHACARDVITRDLATLGIKTLYLFGDRGREMTGEKPTLGTGSFTRVLATEPEALRRKKDVLVVIGERTQDVGIWAYRSLMREGGTEAASAVGLVKKLAQLDFNEASQDDMKATVPEEVLPEYMKASGAPGLILLNPGQRLYSHELNEIMSQNTWLARPRSSAIGSPYVVDEVRMSLPPSRQHIYTNTLT